MRDQPARPIRTQHNLRHEHTREMCHDCSFQKTLPGLMHFLHCGIDLAPVCPGTSTASAVALHLILMSASIGDAPCIAWGGDARVIHGRGHLNPGDTRDDSAHAVNKPPSKRHAKLITQASNSRAILTETHYMNKLLLSIPRF